MKLFSGTHEAATGERRNRRRISIYVLLSLLILVLSVPMLVLFGRFLMESAAERRTEALDRGLAAADQVADALDREFQSLATMLAVFASSGWIEDEEFGRLYLRAKTALAGTETYLIVLDENLEQLLDTRTAYGASLGQTPDPMTARRALESGHTVISPVFRDRLSHTATFNMARPTSGGSRARVLILTRSTKSLGNVIDTSVLPSGWNYGVFDSEGQLALRATEKSQSTPPQSCTDGTSRPPGHQSADSTEFVVVQRLIGAPWSVCVWAPYDTLHAPVSAGWRTFSVAALLVIVASLVAAALIGRIIVAGTARAARVGRLLEQGNTIGEHTSNIAEIDDVLQILEAAARERTAKEEELRLLLGETAHRAKNQLAIASSLVRLAAASARDVPQLRDDLTSRFVALSRSVDMLVGRNWQTVSLPQLIDAQLKPFMNGQPERLEMSGEDMAIAPTAAQSLGLVLNELATNASKYGAWSNADGCVTVEWAKQEDRLRLSWSESGGPSVAEPAETGFGTQLIDALVIRSFSGEAVREYAEAGMVARIELPLAAIQPQPSKT